MAGNVAGDRPASRPGARRLVILAGFSVAALLWVLAAHALWHSTVPAGLHPPAVDPGTLFSARFLSRSRAYERLLDIDRLLSEITLLIVLVIYAKQGHRLMRESAAGRIGTGMLLGMMGFAIVWLAEIPFGLVAVWWERSHGVSHEGYVSSVTSSFLGLGGEFLFVSFALLVAMGLAGLSRRWWWVGAAPLFAALALLSSYLSIYLIPDTHPLRDPGTSADMRSLARIEGIPGTKAEVQEVRRFTTAPNAESVGFGATRRVILWDTLLDGRFDRRQVRAVIAHELGHLAHNHILKHIGWLMLFLIPATAIVALATGRVGGLGRPEAVPLALLVFVALQLLTGPLTNIVSRRDEAEADWSSLRATRDPQAAKRLFEGLARTSLANPDPPSWSYALFADHPTIVQRIAMIDAWHARNPGP